MPVKALAALFEDILAAILETSVVHSRTMSIIFSLVCAIVSLFIPIKYGN